MPPRKAGSTTKKATPRTRPTHRNRVTDPGEAIEPVVEQNGAPQSVDNLAIGALRPFLTERGLLEVDGAINRMTLQEAAKMIQQRDAAIAEKDAKIAELQAG